MLLVSGVVSSIGLVESMLKQRDGKMKLIIKKEEIEMMCALIVIGVFVVYVLFTAIIMRIVDGKNGTGLGPY